MSALRRHPELGMRQALGQRLRGRPGHQEVVTRGGHQRGRSDPRQIRPRIEAPPRADALEQILRALEMRRAMRDLGRIFS